MGMFIGRRDDDSGYVGTSWWLSSKKDTRFTASGEAAGLWAANAAMDEWILAKSKELGVEPPDDIEIGAMKS